MSRVFRITPKRTKRANGTVLTPDMVITVTTRQHTTDPFYNGAVEIQEQYMRMFQFDYKRANCSKYDFDFVKLDLMKEYERGSCFYVEGNIGMGKTW